jgi:DNA polymerase-3 subunit delta
MLTLKLEQLDSHLARQLAPVYVLHGDEPLLALEAADAIRARARAMGYLERVVLTGERGFKWAELGAATANLSLFGDKRLVELRLPSGKPGTDGGAAIESYCARLAPETMTLVSLPRVDKAGQSSAWFKALERAAVPRAFPSGSPLDSPGRSKARARRRCSFSPIPSKATCLRRTRKSRNWRCWRRRASWISRPCARPS